MLLNNPNKTIIKEKLKTIQTDNSIKFKKNNTEELKVDDIYTLEHSNLERNEDKYNNLPIDTSISSYLPNLSSLIQSEYNNLKKEYFYNFQLKNDLPHNIPTANIVIFKINHFNSIPFLMFLFYNEADSYSFVEVKNKSIEQIHDFVSEGIFSLHDDLPSFRGYKKNNNKYYLFYELSQSEDNENINNDTTWIWGTLHEILNTHFIFNKPIKTHVTSLFIKFNELTRLTMEDDINLYETPMIGYYLSDEIKMNYISNFGAIKELPSGEYGPYFYFNLSFDTLAKSNDETKRIIRFALFLGKCYLTNHSYNDDLFDKYNSIIISNKDKVIVKQLEQQVPLSIYV